MLKPAPWFISTSKPTFAYIIVGLGLLVVNVLLAQQNKTLKVYANKPDRSLELKLGTQLPALEGTDPYGNHLKLEYGQDNRPTLLLIFSPKCSPCTENMANWQALMKGIDKQATRVVAVSLQAQGASEYAAEHFRDIQVIAEITPESRLAYNLNLSPQTIIIDGNGKAENLWSGLLKQPDKADIERILNVQLAGVSRPEAEETDTNNRKLSLKGENQWTRK